MIDIASLTRIRKRIFDSILLMGDILHFKSLNANLVAIHRNGRLRDLGDFSHSFLHFAKILEEALRINIINIAVIRVFENHTFNKGIA